MRSFAAGFVSCLLLIVAVGVVAKAMAEAWLTIPIASWHAEREREKGKGSYEQTNPGLGLEYVLNEKWRLGAGMYRSSIRTDAGYVGAVYLPWNPIRHTRIGASVGMVSGYEGNLIPLLIPTVVIEGKRWGVNLLVVPPTGTTGSGGVGLQLKWKLP